MTESSVAQEAKPMEVDGEDGSTNDSQPLSNGNGNGNGVHEDNDTSDDKLQNGDANSESGEPTTEVKTGAANETSFLEKKARLIRESPCGNDCTNGCNAKFTEEQRVQIYDIYWALGTGPEVRESELNAGQNVRQGAAPSRRRSPEQRKWVEKYCIEKVIPKVTAKSIGSARNRTFVYLYYLPQPSENMIKLRVCKKYMSATLGLTDRVLQGYIHHYVGDVDLQEPDGSPPPGYDCTKRQMFLLREFIQKLPCEPVHYCRNEACNRRLYELPDSIPDLNTLYGMYSSHEDNLSRDPVDEDIFRSVFHDDYNIAFSTGLRSDDCSTRESRKSKSKN